MNCNYNGSDGAKRLKDLTRKEMGQVGQKSFKITSQLAICIKLDF